MVMEVAGDGTDRGAYRLRLHLLQCCVCAFYFRDLKLKLRFLLREALLYELECTAAGREPVNQDPVRFGTRCERGGEQERW